MFSFFNKKNTPKLALTLMNALSIAFVLCQQDEEHHDPIEGVNLFSLLLTIGALHLPQYQLLLIAALGSNFIETSSHLALLHREEKRHLWRDAYMASMVHFINLAMMPLAPTDVDNTDEIPEHKSRAFLSIDW